MADKTTIEWTDMTWNPIRGCSRVSQGCTHCYAERNAARFSGPDQPYEGLIHPTTGGWNGSIKLVPEALQIPWRLTRGRKIFVNSMSDLFHPGVPFEFIAAVFWVMSVTTRHTYQILTKRPERMLEFFRWLLGGDERDFNSESARWDMGDRICALADLNPSIQALGWTPHSARRGGYDNCGPAWPCTNVWLGVSVEDQATAEERIPILLQCPAAVRWISAEPLLGHIDLRAVSFPSPFARSMYPGILPVPWLDWVVAGGESGPGARPMHPDWLRSLRDQCAAAGVPFLFKQWGEWAPYDRSRNDGAALATPNALDEPLQRFGKKRAGRILDGAMHDGYPEPR